MVASSSPAGAPPQPLGPEESPSRLSSDMELEAGDELPEAASALTWDPETERVEELREAANRGGPRGPGSGGKGRSRREREQLTNRPVPGGHERKIASKIRATLAKRRRRQQKAGGRARSKKPLKLKKQQFAGDLAP